MKNSFFKKIRQDFPIINHFDYEKKIVIYFDNANTTHKPKKVIQEEYKFYKSQYEAGIVSLSSIIFNKIENIRANIADYMNAYSSKEIIFVKGTTEAINLIANAWGEHYLNEGDNIIISKMEHHSNILPWLILSKKKNIDLKFIPLNNKGELDFKKIPFIINKNTKLVAITHISNVIGTINPIQNLIKLIKSINKNTLILIDGAQAISRQNIDFQNINCDFYAFSAQKIYGPTGIGVLYVKKSILEKMIPWQVGGGIVDNIEFINNKPIVKYYKIPWRFEAGTPNIGGILGLGQAIKYIKNIGISNIIEYENYLTEYFLNNLKSVPNIKIYGYTNPTNRVCIISFNILNIHSYDIGNYLDNFGIAIRTGHLCAIPLMKFYNVSTMCRASLGIYNNTKEIDFFIKKLTSLVKLVLKN